MVTSMPLQRRRRWCQAHGPIHLTRRRTQLCWWRRWQLQLKHQPPTTALLRLLLLHAAWHHRRHHLPLPAQWQHSLARKTKLSTLAGSQGAEDKDFSTGSSIEWAVEVVDCSPPQASTDMPHAAVVAAATTPAGPAAHRSGPCSAPQAASLALPDSLNAAIAGTVPAPGATHSDVRAQLPADALSVDGHVVTVAHEHIITAAAALECAVCGASRHGSSRNSSSISAGAGTGCKGAAIGSTQRSPAGLVGSSRGRRHSTGVGQY